jgi:hypothetical protein
MHDMTPKTEKEPPNKKLKYLLRAALVGAIAALSGAFALCVYDAHTRLHEGWCDCAKYAAMVAAAFSHPIAIAGALAGVCVFSIAYLIWSLYQACRHHFRQDGNRNPN